MITLSASVGSLILVKVPGNVKEDVNLLSFDVHHTATGSSQTLFMSGKQIVAAVRFQNNGDVQEQPFGKVLLEQGGKVLATYEVNNTTPLGNVLPDSIRKFIIPLDKVGVFGKYTLVGNFGYGSSGQLLSGKTTFYVVPVAAILLILLILIALVFFIFVFPRLVRRYNQRIIRRARR